MDVTCFSVTVSRKKTVWFKPEQEMGGVAKKCPCNSWVHLTELEEVCPFRSFLVSRALRDTLDINSVPLEAVGFIKIFSQTQENELLL